MDTQNYSSSQKLKRIVSYVFIWLNIVPVLFYCMDKSLFESDLKRALRYIPFEKTGISALNYSLLYILPFRSIVYYRMCKAGLIYRLFGLFMLRPLKSIEISGNIDEGLWIFHNMGCVIAPHSIGKNCTIAQGVTIGAGRLSSEGIDSPVIGDNAWICPNAVVFGGIVIGDNVTIGAGCIVSKSVPDNCTVVGNPARIVKINGEKCDRPI